MAGRFTVIPQSTFEEMQMDAGVLLKTFNPASPTVTDENIICATTGGINASCTAEYSDLGEDVDNCPNNMKELKHLDGWSCTMSFTSLGTSPESIKLSLGAADIDTDFAVLHDDRSVPEHVDTVDDVRTDEHCLARLAQLLDVVLEFFDRVRIEAEERLVHEDDIRIRQKSDTEVQLLLHAL